MSPFASTVPRTSASEAWENSPLPPLGALRTPGDVRSALESLENRLLERRDRRGTFTSAYLVTTRLLDARISDANFSDSDAAQRYLVSFADLYFEALRNDDAGRTASVPPAWRQAFAVARDGRPAPLRDLLLGINAHLHRDLPFALLAADLDLSDPRAEEDHRRIDRVLHAAMPEVRNRVLRRWGPGLLLPSRLLGPWIDRWMARVFTRSRRRAWETAMALRGSRGAGEEASRVRQIEREAERRAAEMADPKHAPVRALWILDPDRGSAGRRLPIAERILAPR